MSLPLPSLTAILESPRPNTSFTLVYTHLDLLGELGIGPLLGAILGPLRVVLGKAYLWHRDQG